MERAGKNGSKGLVRATLCGRSGSEGSRSLNSSADGADQNEDPTDWSVDGAFILYRRYDPRRASEGLPPLQLDSGPPKGDLGTYMQTEGRFRVIQQNAPARFAQLTDQARHDQAVRRALYERLSADSPR